MLVCDVISCEWFCFRLDELIIMNVATEVVLLPARNGEVWDLLCDSACY